MSEKTERLGSWEAGAFDSTLSDMNVGMHRKRVVITGIGAITPLGQDSDKFWEHLVAGKSGIGPMTLCDPTGYPCQIAGEVRDFDPIKFISSRDARRMARFSQMAVAAGLEAGIF